MITSNLHAMEIIVEYLDDEITEWLIEGCPEGHVGQAVAHLSRAMGHPVADHLDETPNEKGRPAASNPNTTNRSK